MKLDTAIVRRIQARVGVKADGILGPVTLRAIATTLDAAGEFFTRLLPDPGKPVGDSPTADERSERNIATLLPQVRPLARALITQCAKAGVLIKVIDGTRTYAQQADLRRRYEAGGPKAAEAGWSNHNFGLAFDIGVFSSAGGYLKNSPLYAVAGRIGKALGLTWGGDWKGRDEDPPHFQLRPAWAANMSERAMLEVLRARKSAGRPLFD